MNAESMMKSCLRLITVLKDAGVPQESLDKLPEMSLAKFMEVCAVHGVGLVLQKYVTNPCRADYGKPDEAAMAYYQKKIEEYVFREIMLPSHLVLGTFMSSPKDKHPLASAKPPMLVLRKTQSGQWPEYLGGYTGCLKWTNDLGKAIQFKSREELDGILQLKGFKLPDGFSFSLVSYDGIGTESEYNQEYKQEVQKDFVFTCLPPGSTQRVYGALSGHGDAYWCTEPDSKQILRFATSNEVQEYINKHKPVAPGCAVIHIMQLP